VSRGGVLDSATGGVGKANMRAGRVVLTILLAAAVVQILSYYPQLPSTVASHFGSEGRPNGWSSKEGFFGIYLGVLALVLASFVGLPVLLGRIAPDWINLPNKDYWLAPQRQDRTVAILAREMLWFGNATIALMIAVIELAIRANLAQSPRLSEPVMWSLLSAYLVYLVIWLIRFYRLFARPRQEGAFN
jgi:uncharacterized membrane protein